MPSQKTKTYRSFSSKETKNLGALFAKRILTNSGPKKKAEHKTGGALIFALEGDLGAGKTTFVQGLFDGLKIKRRATSPTFIIMRRHGIKKAKFKNIFHIDAYRLKSEAQLEALDFKKIAADRRNVIVIEWADQVKKVFPKTGTVIAIRFMHGRKENERKISFRTEKYSQLLTTVKKQSKEHIIFAHRL